MRGFLIVIAYILAAPVCVLGILGAGLWLSDRTHEFGPWDPRYLLLVRGSDLSRLDLLEPISGSIRYTAQGRESTSPARVFVDFTTTLAPERVLETYETRCAAIGLTPKPTYRNGKEPVLLCDGPSSELGIQANRSNDRTAVTIGGWIY